MAAEIRLPEQNTVLLTGRLTRDAELKYTGSGTAMCRFGMAVNRRYKDPKSGEWKDDATFVNVVVWREAAERCGKVLKKGSPVHVEGNSGNRLLQVARGAPHFDLAGVDDARISVVNRATGFTAPPN